MITKRLADLLTAQIASELTAHMLYYSISISFRRQSLSGWAKLFFDQGVEEATHADKIVDFLVDQDVAFDLPKLAGTRTEFKSALDACRAALANEQKVTLQFQAMAKAALDEHDATAHQFLQWFIEEQVEEERTAQALVDLVASGINLFQAEPLLDGIVAED
ncbi:MAG TPA: ferritin [Candidatus Limnocylindrales bacterium]|jgi:ferritin